MTDELDWDEMNTPPRTFEEKGLILLRRLYDKVKHNTDKWVSVFDLQQDDFTREEALQIGYNYLVEQGWAKHNILSTGNPDILITSHGIKEIESGLSDNINTHKLPHQQVNDIEKLITNHQRRLQKLKETKALKGINTDPELLIEIEDIEAELKKLEAEQDKLRKSAKESLQIVKADFADRLLSPRETIKVNRGLDTAYNKVTQYLEEGKIPRADGFFDRDFDARSASDEILEGVLFKCKNEHEEKKLRFISNIFANVAFMEEVSPEQANWLLQKAQELTYRQLCIIALIEQKDNKGVSWGPKDGDPAFQIEYEQIDYMLARDYSPDSVRSYEETGEGLWVIGLSRIGKFCYEVMGLNEIPEDDLQKLKPRFPKAFE